MYSMESFYYFVKKNGNKTRIAVFDCAVNTTINSNFEQLTEEQVDFYLEHPNASMYEIERCELFPVPEPVDDLTLAKQDKMMEIDSYDVSENVNGFFYNDIFMWLDRETRATLRNTIDSLKIMGRDKLNIWYGELNIYLNIEQAEYLLAALEVYATDCYNVTAQHKIQVNSMESVEDVLNFDITKDYPERLRF